MSCKAIIRITRGELLQTACMSSGQMVFIDITLQRKLALLSMVALAL